ncbi:MAG TPA: hypothetical protein PK014_07495 [Thermoanaerobaculia bacterium]|nr:hypothetical protein [Thermoanaerobaculia bacterium]HUM29909.1 hypothetical protein [Thermoanaerobaculia bacterium]HXK68224.1 hypothetical protein [Thermoanaerobaculia bacterium]
MELSFMDKIKLALYRKGMKGYGPSILAKLEVGSTEWFQIANETILSTDLELRNMILFQILHPDALGPNPKKRTYFRLLYTLLEKGTIDEKREIVTFIRDNPTLFDTKDEFLMGRLTVAQRESDPRIANTAEEALRILRGETD